MTVVNEPVGRDSPALPAAQDGVEAKRTCWRILRLAALGLPLIVDMRRRRRA